MLGAFLFLSIISIYPRNRLGAYILSQFSNSNNKLDENQKTIATVLPSIAPDFWEHISYEASLSSVAVQVFKDDRIVKFGSGIVLSSDGLIVIPAGLTYSGGIYQVLYEDKIVKGFITAFDLNRNLAIIKLTNSELNMNVSDLNTNLNYQSGQDVLITGKLASLSRPDIISQKGIVSHVNGDKITLDTFTNISLLGAKVLNSKSELMGMLYIRGGKSYIINSKDIDIFFKEYLNKIK